MAKFTLTIDCDNDAFQMDDPFYEIGRILAKLATEMESGDAPTDGPLLDIDGSEVGTYTYGRG